MSARLIRVRADNFDLPEAGGTLPNSTMNTIDVDRDWESILYVFGSGTVGVPMPVEIFVPSHTTGDEYDCDERDIRYHSTTDNIIINKPISGLDGLKITAII